MDRLDWERLDERGSAPFNLNPVAARAKVPGGWLVRMHGIKEEVDSSHGAPLVYNWGYGGLTFIPDPGHTWDGNSLL